MRYKDVVREQILHAETAEDAISSDEDGDDNRGSRNDNGGEGRRGLAYDEEQERLRKGFLGMVAEHDGGGGGGSDEDGGSGDGERSSGEDGDGQGLLKVRCARTFMPCLRLSLYVVFCVSLVLGSFACSFVCSFVCCCAFFHAVLVIVY